MSLAVANKTTPHEIVGEPISPWLVLAIPFAIGTGLAPLLGIALVGALVEWRCIRLNLIERPSIGRATRIYLLIAIGFLGLYVTQSRLDFFPPGFGLPKLYFVKVVGASLLVIGLPLLFKSLKHYVYFMGAIALGAFTRGAATVLLTSYYLSVPSPGHVFDLKTWSIGNRSPFSNMLTLATVFYTGVLANQRSLDIRPHGKLLALIVVIFAVVFGGLLQARLFFIVVFMVCPGLLLANALFDAKRAKGIVQLLVFGAVLLVGFYMLNHLELGQRGTTIGSALTDIRFELYKSFWLQIKSNPLAYAQVNPTLVEQHGIPQFHNYFADIQRVSGTWAFIAANAIVIYVIYLVAWLATSRAKIGKLLGFVMIPCLIILNTSVEPEGGGQTYLMMLTIGVVAAISFDRIKSGIA